MCICSRVCTYRCACIQIIYKNILLTRLCDTACFWVIAGDFSVLQCVAACCSVLHSPGFVTQHVFGSSQEISTDGFFKKGIPLIGDGSTSSRNPNTWQCCSVLQCVAVRCSVLQCVTVCYNVLQCVFEFVHLFFWSPTY